MDCYGDNKISIPYFIEYLFELELEAHSGRYDFNRSSPGYGSSLILRHPQIATDILIISETSISRSHDDL